MTAIAEMLTRGLQYHLAGNLQQAEQLYRQILHVDPRHADALHLLGVIAHQVGRNDLALDYLGQALRIQPTNFEAHNNLGTVLKEEARPQEAVASFQEALRLKPDFAEAHNNLGNAFTNLHDLDAAVASYREALRLKPNYAEAHNNQGTVLKELGLLAEAEASFRQALRLNPNVAAVHDNLGNVLQKQGRPDEAIACYQKALRLKPDFAEAYCDLALVLLEQGNFTQAEANLRQALRLKPDCAVAHDTLGGVLREQGKLEEAVASYRQGLCLKPNHAEAHNNLGAVLTEQRKLDEAVACFGEALRLKPAMVATHVNLACIHLLRGDLEKGWTQYEWRWRSKDFEMHPLFTSKPLWDGSPLGGRTILLHAEQGLGDTMQFIRYAARVGECGGRVLLFCPQPLVRLLSRCPAIERVISYVDRFLSFDVHAPLLSLPRLLGTTSVQRIPAPIPYLDADPDLMRSWHARLESLRGFRVGIFWQGNPRHENMPLRHGDRLRSFPLAIFASLARLRGVTLVSLQKGFGTEQLSQVADRFAVTDLGSMLYDFADTAAVMKNLDLVISADSAPAHLAGALGVPVWVPLPTAPCWRWLLHREDSPWYPTMRLFRQRETGNWDEVFERMTHELDRKVRAARDTETFG